MLKLAAEIRQHSQSTGLIIFSYLNPDPAHGIGKVLQGRAPRRHRRSTDYGFAGGRIRRIPARDAAETNLATVFLAAPTSTDERLKRIAAASSGFVYAVSRTGVTGARQQLPEDARKLVRRLRKYTKLPIAVGFGISTPQQFAAVGKFADAAVIGSAIVETIERNPGKEAESVAEFIRQLSAISSQLSASGR